MKALWTKLFYFSASFSRGDKVYGHNYTLSVTVHFSETLSEDGVEKKINDSLIQKIHSRDLGLDVDFLRKTEITDFNLLKNFSKIISTAIKPAKLHSLSLDHDSRTKLFLPVNV